MNFILVSPQFPSTYYKFALALKGVGFTVLGIGDTPYEQLTAEVKTSLTEYYYCPNMNDYGSMYKAVAFYAFKYGRIDWIESHNEWWLETDARLRADFNIVTGIKYPFIIDYKAKAAMKTYFAKAGLPYARFQLINNRDDAETFIASVGYPVFVKPNIGVGSVMSFKLANKNDLDAFFEKKINVIYIMEEFIEGTIESFDGIADAGSHVVYEASNVFPRPNYLVVSELSDDMYYTTPFVPKDLSEAGRKVISAFEVKNRVFHLEFFRLSKDYPHLGKAGSLIPLEVNMRPAGGYTPEMISTAMGVSLYEAWAKTIAGHVDVPFTPINPCYVAAPARRDRIKYAHTHEEIMKTYQGKIFSQGAYPPIISEGMGDNFYMAKMMTKDEVESFFVYVLEPAKVI